MMTETGKRRAVATSWIARQLIWVPWRTTISVGRTDIPRDVEFFISVRGRAFKIYIGSKDNS